MSYYDRDKTHGSVAGLSSPRPHHGMTAEYQQSSIPWLQEYASATNQNVDFPFVTRWIIVTAVGAAAKIAFSSTGIANSQYLTIPSGEMSPRIEVKCKEIWVTCGAEVNIAAGLTNVVDFPDITGLDGIVGA